MASTEDDGWYGSGLLPGSVDNSEANKHYAQFCQATTLDPFNPSPEEGEDCVYFCPDKIRDTEDKVVVSEMESALNNYQDIGKNLGNVVSGSYQEEANILTQWILGGDELCNVLS